MRNEMNQKEIAIRLSGVKKMYKLGQIGGGTLHGDLESWWARIRGKEDPNTEVGTNQRLIGQTFMALNGIDLTVHKGEALGIIGGNGAGKSTMLKLLSRVTAPTEGEIDIYGRIASMLEVGTGFHGEMTGRENIYLNGAILGMTRAEIDAKMEDIIEFSEVRDFIDTPVKRYSSGMYVKLAFSVAAHLDSEIMIMDEVLAVGDMAFQRKCLNRMKAAAKQEGRTVLYVSHSMNTIRQLCDRCIVLDQGRIVYDGDVETAIGIYSGKSGNALPLVYELNETPRPSSQHGHEVRITKFEFLADQQAVFDRTEPIRFRIGFDVNKDIDGLKLYYIVNASNGDTVGLAQTYQAMGDVRKGHSYTYEFSWDVSNLAEDVYNMTPDLFSDDGNGKHWSVDHPLCMVLFKIVENEPIGLEWKVQTYGHIRTNPVLVEAGGPVDENN